MRGARRLEANESRSLCARIGPNSGTATEAPSLLGPPPAAVGHSTYTNQSLLCPCLELSVDTPAENLAYGTWRTSHAPARAEPSTGLDDEPSSL